MRTIEVCASRTYSVLVGAGLLTSLGEAVRNVTTGHVLVVTDEHVAPLYLAGVRQNLLDAGLTVSTVSIPAGESSKTLAHYANLLQLLAARGLTRTDAVLALGGGVVGDLAGFAAATYLRGIPIIQVPTTLLAMVDSSVGGKTAVDLPAGKNLVGAFHQPSLVVCDLDTLQTLPEAVFTDGCAEVIKTAILFDRALFEHLREKGRDFDREAVVARCIECKRDVVCADEFDSGERQKLNLGHTIGHAIEACSGFTVSHGCAVAIGTAWMARAFFPHPEQIEAVFRAFGLPVETEFSSAALAAAALSDKKRAGGSITLVVPREIGACTLEVFPIECLQAVFERRGIPLETSDLVLKKPKFEDWSSLYRNLWSHPESAKYMLWSITTTEEDARERMRRTLRFLQTHPDNFYVYEKKSGEAIGFAGVEEAEPGVWQETGIALGPDFTGRGYGKQLLHLLMRYAAEVCGAKVFRYSTRRQNEASRALARSCGFAYTGSEQKEDPRTNTTYELEHYERAL